MLNEVRVFLLMPMSSDFQNCGESVNSVEGGVVGNAGFEEILATTYTGNASKIYLRLCPRAQIDLTLVTLLYHRLVFRSDI